VSAPTLASSASAGAIGIGKQVVYDRLTNPSNFTGSMKNAFGQDLAKKRQKVQQIKSGIPTKKEGRDGNSSPFVFLTSRSTHNKEHMAAYLDGNSSSCNTSGEFEKPLSSESLPIPPLQLNTKGTYVSKYMDILKRYIWICIHTNTYIQIHIYLYIYKYTKTCRPPI
jgi:hypothetical protein